MKKYKDIEDFILQNPEWISVKDKLPEKQTEVLGLIWMFNNFAIDKVYFSYGGSFETHGKYGWWTEKVSHWKPIDN